MSRIYGVLCDSCGKSDIEGIDESEFRMYEDRFPKSGWMSVSIWTGEGVSRHSDSELMACSVECLIGIGETLKKMMEEKEDDHGHSHD